MTVVETLGRLIAHDSVSDRPLDALAGEVAQRGEDLGFVSTVHVDPDDPGKANVVSTLGPPGEDGLILSGHLDVVPVVGQPWDSDPFVLTERDGTLYGRGTADMKGFVACALHALARLDLSQLRRRLVLVWTHDEEIGCLGSGKLAAALGERPDDWPTEALIGEPTDFRIFRMHPGHVAMTITTHGASAHSSKPDLGANAIRAMARVITMLERLEVELRSLIRPDLRAMLERPHVTMNVGTIQGGSAINLVPDHCELRVGYRPLPGDDPVAIRWLIAQRLAELKLPPGTQVSWTPGTITPSMLTPEGTPLQGVIEACCPQARGGTLGASFGTDGGNLEQLGIRSLIFGPGSIDVAHKANECVSLEALHQGVDAVEAIVRSRCL
jgi:acetylornithine deacetylase